VKLKHLKEIKMVMNKDKGKRYSPALIERATALAEEIGPTRAAQMLGIQSGVVNKWVCRKRDGRYMSISDSAEKKELALANRELQKLRKENEDLKKANIVLRELASFFTKDHPNSNSEWSVNSFSSSRKRN